MQTFSRGFNTWKKMLSLAQCGEKKEFTCYFPWSPCPKSRNKARRLISDSIPRPYWSLTSQVVAWLSQGATGLCVMPCKSYYWWIISLRMKNIGLCSIFFVTQETSVPVASRFDAGMFIEGQISPLLLLVRNCKMSTGGLFPASCVCIYILKIILSIADLKQEHCSC